MVKFPGSIDVYESNVGIDGGSKIYPFVVKDNSGKFPKTIDVSNYNENFDYGNILTGSYPLTASIDIDRFVEGAERLKIKSLRNRLNSYQIFSNHYAYSSSFGNKETQPLALISIPSLFYGSSIKKGSVDCQFFVTGVFSGELVDEKRNGELRQKYPQDNNSGSIAGVVLYNEGCIILTGSWSIHPSHTERYNIHNTSSISPSWYYFGTTGSSTPADLTNVCSSSFSLNFKGTTFTPVLTMFAHAPKGELNYSNNPTFIEYGQMITPLTGASFYKENPNVRIKNITQTPFIEPTGSFQKITYFNKIGVYDKDKNLIGIVKFANNIRKTENTDITLKLRIDL